MLSPTWGPVLALADVFVDQVHALAAVLTGITMALIELVLTPVARVAWHAVTGVAGDAVYAGAVVARVGLAVIDVAFTESTLEPWRDILSSQSTEHGHAS